MKPMRPLLQILQQGAYYLHQKETGCADGTACFTIYCS